MSDSSIWSPFVGQALLYLLSILAIFKSFNWDFFLYSHLPLYPSLQSIPILFANFGCFWKNPHRVLFFSAFYRLRFGFPWAIVTDALQMGKGEDQNLPQQHRREGSSGFLCGECSIAFRRVSAELNFKCLFVLILGFAVFLPGFFWLLPLHERNLGFEAKDAIKLSGTYVSLILDCSDLSCNFVMGFCTFLMLLNDRSVLFSVCVSWDCKSGSVYR